MEADLLNALIRVISGKTGLDIQEQSTGALISLIEERAKILGLDSEEEYCRMLIASGYGSRDELRLLASKLTPGETYFFRDRGQFSLLEMSILPELIAKAGPGKTLRIWSAGCSTGEEPYSLAMLLDGLIPDRDVWNIVITGTDINEEAIEKARKGRFGARSIRMELDKTMARYFGKEKDEWILDENIRKMVRFEVMNLVDGGYPDESSIYHDMDLILCRNVFIYFEPAIVGKLVQRMAQTLRKDGYLMAGHAEITGLNKDGLQPRIFPEAVLYQRVGAAVEEAPHGPILHESVFKPPKPSPYTDMPKSTDRARAENRDLKTDIESVKALMAAGNYRLALWEAESLCKQVPMNFDIHYLMAQAYANTGQYDQAVSHCEQAIKLQPLQMEPFYLMAQIAREQGDIVTEKQMLGKVIYLSPAHIAAYLELGMIYANEGDTTKAARMRSSALDILKGIPRETPVDPYEGMTAGELIAHVQKLLDQHEAITE